KDERKIAWHIAPSAHQERPFQDGKILAITDHYRQCLGWRLPAVVRVSAIFDCLIYRDVDLCSRGCLFQLSDKNRRSGQMLGGNLLPLSASIVFRWRHYRNVVWEDVFHAAITKGAG